MAEPRSGPSADASSETALLRRAQAGDIQAFGALVEAHKQRIYAVAFKMMQNHADADEVSQEAFVKAFQALGRFRGDSSFFTWVYRIAVNLGLSQLRSRKSHGAAALEGGDSVYLGAPNKVESVGETLEKEQARGKIRTALDQLNPDLRITAVLVYLEGCSPKNAAAVLECAEATVHWRLHKARKLLKKALLHHGGDFQ